MKTEKVYSINFDFRKKEQKRILEYMQQRGYKLLGFKGAKGDGQVAGIPVWFSVPYIRMAGEVKNTYQSLYKVYYVDSSMPSDKSIRMTALSEVVELGSKVTLQEDGSFSVEPGGPKNSILFSITELLTARPLPPDLHLLLTGVTRHFAPSRLRRRSRYGWNPTTKSVYSQSLQS